MTATTPVKKPSKKYPAKIVPPERRWILDRLAEIRDALGIPDTRFAQMHLSRSHAVWDRLRLDKYTGDVNGALDIFEQDLRRLERMMEARNNALPALSETYLVTDSAKAVIKALTDAMARRDNLRLVIHLAPFGSGKSALCDHLRSTFGATVVKATEAWKKSYFAGCAEICRALGASGPWRSTRHVEDDLFEVLRSRCKMLCIDDANSIGPHTCNMIRDICDKTLVPVYLGAIPAFYDEMNKKSYWQSAQMVRRSIAVIPNEPVKPAEVAEMLSGISLNGTLAEASRMIADQANQFAAYGFVVRVREELQDRVRDRDATLDDVAYAIKVLKAKWRLVTPKPQVKK
ncbi:MAG TPA: hypothetical protein PKE55_11415 [Kiritimatiellia bacterium]|nr:hypothetical protein [Kiritimatiellia bacterium]